MNIFCFSLEGSTDSLYEAPQTSPGPTSQSSVWGESEPCATPAFLQTLGRQCKTDLKKEKMKSRASELVRINDEAGEGHYKMNCSAQKERIEEKEKDCDAQVVEDKTYLQKIHKLVTSSVEQSSYPPDISAKMPFKEDHRLQTCLGDIKKPTKKLKESNQQPEAEYDKDIREMDGLWNPEYFHPHWIGRDTCSFWESTHHYCHRSTVDPWLHNGNYTLPRGSNHHQYKEPSHEFELPRMEHPSLRIICSFTELDMTETMRSYSFGRFDTSKKESSLEKQESTLGHCADGDFAEGDHVKGGLGKKMKAISLTMRKKMGKKYVRALSEEAVEGGDGDQEAEGLTDAADVSAKVYTKSSNNSVENLFSIYSGQSSSSSGVTSGSGESLRLQAEVVDTVHFCGKAKVHTDFLPSPYDTESLKLKAGDVIDIISKPPMGIWTGMLNGKVGSFKFIYVDVLHEEPATVHRMGNHGRSKRPRPKTLQEFLERLNLEEYMSSLLLNGYQTVDDLKDLKEQHLIELNVTDPEQRNKLLAATECLHDTEAVSQKEAECEDVSESQMLMVKAEPYKCPRDSGCYVASDCADNSSKEDLEGLLHAPLSSSSLAEV